MKLLRLANYRQTNLYFTKLSAFYSTFGKVLEKVGNYEFAFQNFKNMNMEKLSTVNDLVLKKAKVILSNTHD